MTWTGGVDGPDTLSVPVARGSSPSIPAAIGAVAERFGVGVRVIERGGRPERTPWMVGDVELGDDAETWRVEAAFLRALRPRHVLFLCVANSARSQLAEGIARRAAAGRVRISSAGSSPSTVRPEAVAALSEIGIDGSGQRSKSVDEVERPVDAVITLCAEEACPLWLDPAWKVHWPLPDPATGDGLDDFRRVRDVLVERLAVLFGPAHTESSATDG